MNKIKMIAAYKMLMVIAVLLLAGCKYEDGPAISLRSKKARAANTWQIDKAFENGVDRNANASCRQSGTCYFIFKKKSIRCN